jgi:hypothetical protein
MEFGKLYTSWIKYLKKRGLYTRYGHDYSAAVEYFKRRHLAMVEGSYWRPGYKVEIPSTEKFLNGIDNFIYTKGDDLNFYGLKVGVSIANKLLCDFRTKLHINWDDIVDDFGEEEGIYKRPKPINWEITNDEDLWAAACTISESRNIVAPRDRNCNAGQWYDRFYNRGRNFNDRNNIRWRR